MPRIIVTTAPPRLAHGPEVLFDEEVLSVHLGSQHAAMQLVERLTWAVCDAEDAERTLRVEPAGRALPTARPAGLLGPAPPALAVHA